MKPLAREGSLILVEAVPIGGGRAGVTISRREPAERLLVDTATLVSEKVRQRLVDGLPEDVRAEAHRVLEELALELLSANGSGQTEQDLQGSRVVYPDVDPWPDPVDGAELLDTTVQSIGRYVVLSEHAAAAVALWALHTHGLDAFDVSPILAIQSPEMRCGKTTLQRVVRRLVNRPLSASNISSAALFRMIERDVPTLLLDEADSFLTENEELKNLLNAGVGREDAFVIRTVGEDHEPRCFSVFGPKTVALIGRLPATLQDRSIVVPMKRKKKTESASMLRSRDAREVFGPLQRMMMRWAADHLDELREIKPDIPGELNDRAADGWEPLVAIADVAGGTWPSRARAAAVDLSGEGAVPDETPAIRLLSDLRDILVARAGGRISSRALAETLANLEDRPWGTWSRGKAITANNVGRLLGKFEGVKPKPLRLPGDELLRGYDLESCRDAFERYLPRELQVREVAL